MAYIKAVVEGEGRAHGKWEVEVVDDTIGDLSALFTEVGIQKEGAGVRATAKGVLKKASTYGGDFVQELWVASYCIADFYQNTNATDLPSTANDQIRVVSFFSEYPHKSQHDWFLFDGIGNPRQAVEADDLSSWDVLE